MVHMVGLEPTRFLRARDFLTTPCHHGRKLLRCSLDYFFSMPFGLGGWCIVSTHYFGFLMLYCVLYMFQLKHDSLGINILN